MMVATKNRIEDLGQLVGSYEDAGLYKLDNLKAKIGYGKPLPDTIYVIASNMGPWENPLLNRGSMAIGWMKSIQMATRKMLLPFIDLLSKAHNEGKKVRQFNIPRGGDPMNCNPILQNIDGYRSFFPPIDTSYMKLSRIFDVDLGDYRNGLVTYEGDKDISCDIPFVLDTAVASGSTPEEACRIIVEGDKKHGIIGSIPRGGKIYLFIICGSFDGLSRTHKYCQKVGVELVPIFYNAIFEVTSKNMLEYIPGMTDLSILMPGTITTQFMIEQGMYIYGGLLICSVGDTGAHLYDITLYCLETTNEIIIGREKFPRNSLDLDLREWSRIKTFLNNSRWVEIAKRFYQYKLCCVDKKSHVDFTLMGEARNLAISILNSPEASRTKIYIF